MQEYARIMPEFPQPDAAHTLNPDYSSFHKSQMHGRFKQYLNSFLEALHLKKKPLWSAESFRTQLFEAIRHLDQSSKEETHTVHATLESRYYIWGDLFGAFHSLVRGLTYLHNQGILSNDLKIKKDHFVIFNGNVIDQSPYILETLTAVMNLEEKNHAQVAYLAGKHEYQDAWKEYGLKRELTIKAKGFGSESPPLSSALSVFFTLLPRGLLIKGLDDTGVLITPITDLQRNIQLPQETVRARIQGVDRSISYQRTDGLQQLSSYKDATLWNVFSSPTMLNKELYQFSNDAFVLLTPKKDITDWTITLLWKERSANQFKDKVYNLITGQLQTTASSSAGQRKDPLVVGCTLDLSKTSAPLGKRLRAGLELRINKANWEGGIAGMPLKMIFLDDAYTPRRAQKNMFKFVNEYATKTILAPLGTPTTESFLPLVEKENMLVLFPYTGAMIFRQPNLKSFVHLRSSYANEAKALITYAVNYLQAQKFAIFYQDDSYGKAPLQAAEETLRSFKITDWLATAYVRNNPNVDDAAAKILSYNPDVILFFSTHAPSVALIRKLGIHKVASTVFMGISFLTDVFRNFLRSKGLELIMARVMPDPTIPDREIVRNYQDDMFRLNPTGELSVDSLEGYINADFFIHVVNSLTEPISNDAIVAAIEKVKDVSYKGLSLTFNPKTRELLSNVWIDTGKGAWLDSNDLSLKRMMRHQK